MAKHIIDSRNAVKLRGEARLGGKHIPPFLIASITNQCNLHCKGCYARANNSCTDELSDCSVLDASDWDGIFAQAETAGQGA